MPGFRSLIGGSDLIVAPVALNPLMARLAEEAGFKALYLSGGSLGWLKCVTEANLTLTEMISVVLDMRAVCRLPVIMDAGGGWGDPVHIHRTVALCEAAGVAAIELEDQLLPRRVHHHLGVEHLVPAELMAAKIQEAVAARTDPDLVIIGRSSANRLCGLDEALRRAEAYHRAGADAIFLHTRDPEELRLTGERLPAPLMMFAPADGFQGFALSPQELAALGFRIAASSGTAFAAMHKALRKSYECLAAGKLDPFLGAGGAAREMKQAQRVARLERLVEIERRTVMPPG